MVFGYNHFGASRRVVDTASLKAYECCARLVGAQTTGAWLNWLQCGPSHLSEAICPAHMNVSPYVYIFNPYVQYSCCVAVELKGQHTITTWSGLSAFCQI